MGTDIFEDARVIAADLFEVVERSYVENQDDPAWLRAMLEAVAPRLDQGLGLSAWLYDVSDFSNVRLFHPTLINCGEESLQAMFASASHPDMPASLLQWHWATPAGALTAGLTADFCNGFAPWRDTIYRLGIRDLLTLNAYDVYGRGLAINVLCKDRIQPNDLYVEQLERVTGHLIAAYRLRRRARPVAPEAVLAPDGRVLHLEGLAQEAGAELSEAARITERARRHTRAADPQEALAAWRALVDARWSLVDFFDTDGKRMLVARVNDAVLAERKALTKRETQVAVFAARGHSNKLIAYELGLSESAVATNVGAVLQKLALKGRAELATFFAASEVDAATPAP